MSSSHLQTTASRQKRLHRLECPLDRLYINGDIGFRHYVAGNQFRRLFDPVSNGRNMTDTPMCKGSRCHAAEWHTISHIDNARRVKSAFGKLDDEGRAIVRNVCGYDEYPNTPRKKRLLVVALEILADYWRVD